MNCRAKFYVKAVTKFGTGNGGQADQRKIEMSCVYDDGLIAENKAFSTATPTGDLIFTLNNPALSDAFNPGEVYYLDFTKVEKSDS